MGAIWAEREWEFENLSFQCIILQILINLNNAFALRIIEQIEFRWADGFDFTINAKGVKLFGYVREVLFV